MSDNKYSLRWRHYEAKKSADEDKTREQHKSQYAEHVNAFYNAVTDIYLQGWGQSFHLCRYPRGPERNSVALARHEHYLAHAMGIQTGMRVLDVGCGVGGSAREIAAFTGCHITGLNINNFQVKRGRQLIERDGMSSTVELVQGDFMHIPFEKNQFDAVYAIEATLHAPSLKEVYTQCYKVLKPGGIFGVYEWALTDRFSRSDQRHKAIRLGVERGNGIPSLQTTAHAQDAMRAAGFDILIAEDLATRDDPLGWWNPLSGNLKSARGWYDWLLVVRNTWWGRPAMRVLIRSLEWVGVAPAGTCTITEDLLIGNDALVAAGEAGIFTPMFLMVAKKPL